MVRKTDHMGRVIEAALGLAAARGWRGLTLTEIAEATGLSLVELYRVCPAKACILPSMLRRIDEHMLAAEPMEVQGEPVHDLLLEILMRRFEAMRQYRSGLNAILRDLPLDPATALTTLPGLARSMSWALTAASVSTRGLFGAVRVKILGIAYLATLCVWLRDEDADMLATMAALDRNLRWAWFVNSDSHSPTLEESAR